MGRTLKRVPKNFVWPLNKVWGGYLNPFYTQQVECPACSGTGYAPAAKRFKDEWYGYVDFDPVEYGATPITADHPSIRAFAERQIASSPDYYGAGEAAIRREQERLFGLWRNQWCHHLIQADVDALVAAGRLPEFTKRPRNAEQAAELEKAGGYWMKDGNGYTPTADEVNAWSMGCGMGHDAINSWVCVEARCKREGVATTCPVCGGDGSLWPSPEIEKAYDGWTPTHPPKGEGFQLWTTTNEGAPISPVFETLEALCAWCADNATTFGSHKASADEWRRMLDADFVVHKQGNAIFI